MNTEYRKHRIKPEDTEDKTEFLVFFLCFLRTSVLSVFLSYSFV